MEIVKCNKEHIPALCKFYKCVVAHLKENINYPKWTDEHPSEKGIREAAGRGEQYVCIDNGKILGAFVLSEDPEGDYSAGDWSRNLNYGEFLVVHVLAALPESSRGGVGGYMVEKCVELAKKGGYKAVRLDVVPGNLPAANLYMKYGFKYAGTKDLLRGYEEIPVFDLYELNL